MNVGGLSVVTTLELFVGFDLCVGWKHQPQQTLTAKHRAFVFHLRHVFSALGFDAGWVTTSKEDCGIYMEMEAFSCP